MGLFSGGTNLPLLAGLLRGLSLISRDPALGYRGAAVTTALDLAATAVERGAEGKKALEALAEQVKGMVADGNRAPTKEEYNSLRDRSDAAHKILNPQETPDA